MTQAKGNAMDYDWWESLDPITGPYTTINASGVDIPDGASFRVIRDPVVGRLQHADAA